MECIQYSRNRQRNKRKNLLAINANESVVIIMGPIAKPSSPSVRFTEFADPTITIDAKI